jgi:predicted transcriptional regulator
VRRSTLAILSATAGAGLVYLEKMSPPLVTEPDDEDDGEHQHEPENTYDLPQGEDIRRQLEQWFGRQRDAVAKLIRGELPNRIEPLTRFDQPMAEAMTPLLSAYWDEGGKACYERIGLDPDEWKVTNPHTREKIERAAFNFCQSTNATTSDSLNSALSRLRKELAEGIVDRGEALPELTKRVNRVFDRAEKYRARRIAATETSRAVHAAQEQAAIESEIVVGFELLVSGDACPLCQRIAAEVRTVRIGQDFAVIGNNPDYMHIRHPPLHVSCQCAMIEVLSEAYGGPANPQFGRTLDQPDATEPLPADEQPEPQPERLQQPLREPVEPTAEPAVPSSFTERLEADTESRRIVEQLAESYRSNPARLAAERLAEVQARHRANLDAIDAGDTSPEAFRRMRQSSEEYDATLKLAHDRRNKDVPIPKATEPVAWKHGGLLGGSLDTFTGQARAEIDKGLAWLGPLVQQRGKADTLSVAWKKIAAGNRPEHRPPRQIRLTEDTSARSVVHELGHLIESQVPGVKKAAHDFLAHRFKDDETPVRMRDKFPDGDFDKHEKGRKDKFDAHFDEMAAYYVGKTYFGGATEVVSMGIEALHQDAAKFAHDDPEFCAFIVGVLRGTFR